MNSKKEDGFFEKKVQGAFVREADPLTEVAPVEVGSPQRSRVYWKSPIDLAKNDAITTQRDAEFSEPIPVEDADSFSMPADADTSRRDFLKYMGFSTAAVALSSCESPVVKSIPYIVKPEEITPGKADYYASTIYDGYDLCGVLVKCREGRPIRIIPNEKYPEAPNARVQASVLSLYDTDRLKSPSGNFGRKPLRWKSLLGDVSARIKSLKNVVILTPSVVSPSLQRILSNLKDQYGMSHVVYDAISCGPVADAVQHTYGVRGIPMYDISEAKCVVSFGADFLADWFGASLEVDYAKSRSPQRGRDMLRHYQVESNMTLTGANADYRYKVTPSQELLMMGGLYKKLKDPSHKSDFMDAEISRIAKDLKVAKGKSLVLCGVMSLSAQKLALEINRMLGSVCLKLDKISTLGTADPSQMYDLVDRMVGGDVDGLITYNVNPMYTFSDNKRFQEALSKLDLTVGCGLKLDETVSLMEYRLPTHHPLESWGDYRFRSGSYGLSQPVISPLFDTWQFEQILLSLGGEETMYYEYLKDFWRRNILENTPWNQALHDGVFVKLGEKVAYNYNPSALGDVISDLEKEALSMKGLQLKLYTKVGIGDGAYTSNNPWLQELPDPVTRMSWDNYLTISKTDAEHHGLQNWYVSNGALNGDVVDVTVEGKTLKNVPVLVQPGQAEGSVGLSLGYGRQKVGKCGNGVGVNAYPIFFGAKRHTFGVRLQKVDRTHEFATVQMHHTIMGRDIVRETDIQTYLTKPKAVWNPEVALETHKGRQLVSKIDLWDSHDRSIGHHFKLSIDLNSCTGCGSCVVACHAENNVPVVGKEEVRKGRDMHWLRIDRYYSSDMTENRAEELHLGARETNIAMEIPSENPEVVFQPVMCQHCNHAPCETVCPVAATSHGKQGQNQMIYNRCVGTRYCANNCPYKVRRFNWFNYGANDRFDYYMNNDLGRMALNPDVVVRSRGVMEKCSMCIQTTQAAILNAKLDKRRLDHDEIQPACSVGCPTGAIELGDVNDTQSPIVSKESDDRSYYLLEALGVKPNVFYGLKLRNKGGRV